MFLRRILIEFLGTVVAQVCIAGISQKKIQIQGYSVEQEDMLLTVNRALQPNILISTALEGWKIIFVTLNSNYS